MGNYEKLMNLHDSMIQKAIEYCEVEEIRDFYFHQAGLLKGLINLLPLYQA